MHIDQLAPFLAYFPPWVRIGKKHPTRFSQVIDKRLRSHCNKKVAGQFLLALTEVHPHSGNRLVASNGS